MSATTTRQSGETVFSALMLIISVLLFWQSYDIAQFSSLSSPGAVPLAASAIMILGSSIAFANTWKLPKDPNSVFSKHILPPLVGVVVALILIYALLLESLGFLISSAVFLFIGFTILHRSKALTSALLSLAILAVVYIIFRLFFQVILPEGILPEREILAAIDRFFD